MASAESSPLDPNALREVAGRLRVLIHNEPWRFFEAARWLADLPLPDAPSSPPPTLLNAITRYETGTSACIPQESSPPNRAPVFRRLLRSWREISARFEDTDRQADSRFYDLCERDAGRVGLLTALTYDPDFTGSPVGLNWPWEAHPDDANPDRSHDGRAYVWAVICSGTEMTVHTELIRKSVALLERACEIDWLPPEAGPVGGAESGARLALASGSPDRIELPFKAMPQSVRAEGELYTEGNAAAPERPGLSEAGAEPKPHSEGGIETNSAEEVGLTNAGREANAAGSNESTVSALTADHERLLEWMARTPGKCRTVADWAGADGAPIRNRETAGRLFRELARMRLVDRPHGKRKGYALTPEGQLRAGETKDTM